jgi:hypothetical protein
VFEPAFTFDRFVLGGVNELAATAARRAAESPGHTYNPLVICGRSGSGKTHLLHAIAQYSTALEPDLSVMIETAEAVAERVTHGIARGDLEPLAAAYSGLDLLLVDEVERISGMVRTQEELVGIATRMAEEGRQLVLASDLSPAEVPGLIRSFREVMDRGLVVEIAPFDEDTRQTFIDRVAGERGAALNADVIRALAASDFDGAPSLRRAVHRLLDHALAEGRQPNPGDVLRILVERGDQAPPSPPDEFGSFRDDVTRTVALVVETAPWQRRIGEAILRWEGEGLRTTRLEDALLADTPPDVDALIESYSRDANRLLQIRREIGEVAIVERLDDPADLERAERILAGYRTAHGPAPGGVIAPADDRAGAAKNGPGPRQDTGVRTGTSTGPATPFMPETPGSQQTERGLLQALSAATGGSEPPADRPSGDSWFMNLDKVVLDWTDLEGRVVLEPR